MSMETIEFHIRGVVPILLHNNQMADPLNAYTRAMKPLSGKRKKTDDDHYEIARIEWEAGLYLNKDGRVIVPSTCLEAMIRDAAKKNKLGKVVKCALAVVGEEPLLIYDGPEEREQLWAAGDEFVDRQPVKVGMSTVIRTRPKFSKWELKFTVAYDPAMLDRRQIEEFLEHAGAYVGLCDYRPRYGRFVVV